jgi:predicted nucleic acid-binding Zn ribbon protein
MPIYVYEEIQDDGRPGPTFEVLQGISEAPLEVHPVNGTKVRRIVAAVSIAGKFSDLKQTGSLSDRKLGQKGFTKYVKTGEGVYEKSAGKGPKQITRKKS